MNDERVNHDGRVYGKNGEPDVFIPGFRGAKAAFVLFSLGIIAAGIWMLWAPGMALLTGETGEARVSRIIQSLPGEPDQTIRIRKTIEDQGHLARYRHFVEIIGEDGQAYEFEMAVGSTQKPYARVNDTFPVAYLPGAEYAHGIKQLRTWAFGIAFTVFGLMVFSIAWYLFINVGKPVIIDPESEEDLEAEKEALKREKEREEAEAKLKAE
jgi:hypothetical protein